jgi:hypothetical protein
MSPTGERPAKTVKWAVNSGKGGSASTGAKYIYIFFLKKAPPVQYEKCDLLDE